ncbi:DUF3500 domain-containing protein [Deinococcus enclensis]|uniref:DUF3500 domain-containing protein n=1 Tax=Deinococcus enclensis TaxID=1049582 RepID=A0ABT9MHR6_9DEIO|nr:DUF3500 domain-containing protein [Deinococcus enclensis]MDP9766128.1 hypothetical protein [Deinococcus enclensis]
MRRPLKILTALLTAATAGAALYLQSSALAGGAGAPAVTTPAATVTATGTADAQTVKAVNAANAFLATLSSAQKSAVMFAWTDSAQRARWSNFPTGIFQRKGVRWGDMNAAQRAALTTLLGTVLSPDGLKMVQEQMAADEVLRTTDSGGGGGAPSGTAPTGTPPAGATGGTPPAGMTPPTGGAGGGPGNLIFGSAEYYVSFLGTPSATSPWTLQFGGHHLAINATVVGPNITLAPSLTGGQPIRTTQNGKTVTVVSKVPQEMQDAYALLNSLTAAQRSKAVLSNNVIDLVLGPGQDNRTLQPEGLSGSAMTAAQKTRLLALIKDRMGILNANDLAAKLAQVQRTLDQTSFAWYGPTTGNAYAYYRITGPNVLIEFSPQGMGGDNSNHLHNMYREPGNDYGAAWVK